MWMMARRTHSRNLPSPFHQRTSTLSQQSTSGKINASWKHRLPSEKKIWSIPEQIRTYWDREMLNYTPEEEEKLRYLIEKPMEPSDLAKRFYDKCKEQH